LKFVHYALESFKQPLCVNRSEMFMALPHVQYLSFSTAVYGTFIS